MADYWMIVRGRSVIPALLLVLGLISAVAAHLGSKAAERLAHERYRELVDEKLDFPDDAWQEIRPLAGHWGCLSAGLEFLRGVGVVIAVAAALYLVTNG